MTSYKSIFALAATSIFAASNASAANNPSVSVPVALPVPSITQICAAIATNADGHGVPRDFFARLIWKESRFDVAATSPVGAQGIAQFMPGTAKERNLTDPYDFAQALPASAKLLRDLKTAFGNWGLAAAAYNAGPTRVSRWISNGGFLPLETEEYVLDITGISADDFSTGAEIKNRPLNSKLSFDAACRQLPIIRFATISMAQIKPKPWGIQIAGNFRQSAAVRQMQRLKRSFPDVLDKHEPIISRNRSAMGRRGIYAVRIGADSRGEANQICTQLRSAGGACIVTRNR
ncbi:lytic transglycosylase domain-containing protein [Phyllobacterium sp. YR531]|uniref:lytic transglycosylase domain-containing protein n=1 Tax=Phyllobacterium sp. YR531 TaxID=1144343 RepID=UPI00026FCC1B|nr:lytic transglycosylase domain-containing protein [Phyllobacterium sp. YR531]EJN04358.1 soluble lytic murein transglycosylase-like protein [Phyllobacterium sp. YR531]